MDRLKFWRKDGRVDFRILLVFLVLTSGLLVFGKLASEVIEGDTMAFDRMIVAGLRQPLDPSAPIGPHWLLQAMRDITTFGGMTGLAGVTAIVTGYLLAARKSHTAVFLVFAVVAGSLAARLLKLFFDRPRPDIVPHLVDVGSSSFPSGHAMNSAIVYLTLGALLARVEPHRRVRAYVLFVAIALPLTIGFSRIYLGVHWPSDVLGGWVAGGIWALAMSAIAMRLQKQRKIEASSSDESGSGGVTR